MARMQTLATDRPADSAAGHAEPRSISARLAMTLRGRLHYSRRFYGRIGAEDGAGRRAVVRHLVDLAPVRSVLDVGCGTGQWLAAFRSCGVEDLVGIDGPWVPRQLLAVPEAHVLVQDLTRPEPPGRRFDLAVCLEVAEHLSAGSAAGLVDLLVEAAPLVLFSAAVPGQGGSGHVNEQWPPYWASRFAERGYVVVDALRPVLWDDERVPPYMRQNLLVYARPEVIEAHPGLAEARRATDPRRLAVVHPGEFRKATDPGLVPLRRLLWALPKAAAAACGRRLGR